MFKSKKRLVQQDQVVVERQDEDEEEYVLVQRDEVVDADKSADGFVVVKMKTPKQHPVFQAKAGRPSHGPTGEQYLSEKAEQADGHIKEAITSLAVPQNVGVEVVGMAKQESYVDSSLVGICGAADKISESSFAEELEIDEDKLDVAALYELVSTPKGNQVRSM